MPNSYADWRDRLARANDPKFWPITEIDRLLKEGLAQFWGCETGAMVTQIVYYPGGAVAVEALAAAGDLSTVIDTLEPAIARWAAQNNATHLRAIGRPGWAKRLPVGWRHDQSIFSKELAHGH